MNSLRLQCFAPWLLAASLGCLHAQDVPTYETATKLFATPDLNGDGRLDAIVADRATGSVVFGFQAATGTYTWSDSMPTGASAMSCLSVGRLGSVDLCGFTSPTLGRLVFIGLTASTAEPLYTDVFPETIAPQSMAFFPINSATAPELLVVGDNGSGTVSRYGYELRPPLSGSSTPLWKVGFGVPTTKVASVRVKTGIAPRVLEYYGATLFMEGVTVSSLTSSPNGLSGALTNPDTTLFASGSFDGTAYSQFLFYDPGSTTVRTAKITEPTAGTYAWSALTSFTFPQPIKLIETMPKTGGGVRLGVIFTDGSVSLYNYTGTGAPSFYRSLTPGGSAEADVLLPSGNDAVLISRGGQWQRFLTGAADPLTPQFSGPLNLPTAAASVSNVVFLSAEAFAKTNSTVTGTGQVREWTTTASGGPTSWNIAALVSTGLNGLTSPSNATRTAPAGTNNVLLNQLRSNVSIHLDNSTPGLSIGDVTVSPPGGTYPPGAQPPGVGAPLAWIVGTDPATLPASLKYDQPPAGGELIKIPPYLTLNLNPIKSADAVWYRLNDGHWTRLPYQGQIELYANVTLDTFAATSTNRSPTRRQVYTFTNPSPLAIASSTDSNGNGLSDQWEKTFGVTNPSDDPDGDGANNLAEFTAGTDPRNAASIPTVLVLNATQISGGAGTPLLRLEWPVGDGSVTLEASNNLQGPWTTISSGIISVGGINRYDVTLSPPAAPKNFYRLRKP